MKRIDGKPILLGSMRSDFDLSLGNGQTAFVHASRDCISNGLCEFEADGSKIDRSARRSELCRIGSNPEIFNITDDLFIVISFLVHKQRSLDVLDLFIHDNTFILGLEPFGGIFFGQFVRKSYSRLLQLSSRDTSTVSLKNNIEIHTVDT